MKSPVVKRSIVVAVAVDAGVCVMDVVRVASRQVVSLILERDVPHVSTHVSGQDWITAVRITILVSARDAIDNNWRRDCDTSSHNLFHAINTLSRLQALYCAISCSIKFSEV